MLNRMKCNEKSRRFSDRFPVRAILIPALLLSAPAFAHAETAPPTATPPDSVTSGVDTAGGLHLAYTATEGTLPVAASNDEDVQLTPDGKWLDGKPHTDPDKDPAVANLSYTYYAAEGGHGDRPVTFIYNGGPGSSTIWLHMGSVGPKRVVTAEDTPTGAAPYHLADNPYTLLDTSDLVFIDAPGTGFGTITGKDAEKAFWGVNQDGQAFGRFVQRFLTKYNRWNSPKYIFGESYGTTRSAMLADILMNERSIELNGVILLSQILYFDSNIDTVTPGNDLPYELALPSYAATARYHHKLPQEQGSLDAFLKEVETFATGEYAHALSQGNALPDAEKQAIAQKLNSYTGLPVSYLLKANLRVNGGEFEHTLLGDTNTVTGRLDARFQGPASDPLDKTADYDALDSAVGGAYVSLWNQYTRDTLKYGAGLTFKPNAYSVKGFHWDWTTTGPASDLPTGVQVLSHLADAMKQHPNLHVMVNGGYYDLATPFYAAWYEDEHLPVPAGIAKNVEYHWYESGHMVYLHQDSLHQLHDNVAAFIHKTESGAPARP